MEGTIKIIADKQSISFDMEMSRISKMDKLIIFDAMAKALSLDEEQRTVIGATIAIGGMGAVIGSEPTMVAMDKELLRKFRNRATGTGGLTSEEK